MKILPDLFLTDVNAPKSQSRVVILARLDSGDAYFTSQGRIIAGIEVIPSLLTLSAIDNEGVGFELDDSVTRDFGIDGAQVSWINREVRVYSLPSESQIISDGIILFQGVFKSNPQRQGSRLILQAIRGNKLGSYLPLGSKISSLTFPKAAPTSRGLYLPHIYGRILHHKLLCLEQGSLSTLRERAKKGQTHIVLKEATSFPPSGEVVIDGEVYAYQSRGDKTLYGLNLRRNHYAGTQVALYEASKYYAAENALSDITNFRLEAGVEEENLSVTQFPVIDLAQAQVIFNYPPTLSQQAGLETIQINYDYVEEYSTALNGINAIQAATGVISQSASVLPKQVSDTLSMDIVFPIPPVLGGSQRIIQGHYTIDFDVSIVSGTPENGRVIVYIADAIAWVWDGGKVIHDSGTLQFDYNLDTHTLPIKVHLENAASLAFKVDILSARREVVLGNLDQAAFATLRKPDHSLLSVRQSTINPDFGAIQSAKLVIEHFSSSQTLDTLEVRVNSKKVGILSSENTQAPSATHTIAVDLVHEGTAELLSTQIINALTSVISRTDNAVSIPINFPISYTIKEFAGAPLQTYVYALDTEFALPENLIGGTYVFTVSSNIPAGGYVNSSDASLDGIFFEPNGDEQTVTVFLDAGQTSIRLQHDHNFVTGTGAFSTTVFPTIKNIRGTVLAKPTQNALSVSGGSVGGSATLTDGTSQVSGTALSTNVNGTGGQELVVHFPVPPRSVVNIFDLPEIQGWGDLTDQLLEINYVGEGIADVHIVRAYVNVEYERVINIPAESVFAEVTGKSGNPADILKDLIEISGENVDPTSYQNFKTFCSARDIALARSIEDKVSVEFLISTLSEQARCGVFPSPNGFRLLALGEMDSGVTRIQEKDLLDFAVIYPSASDGYENNFELHYQKRSGAYKALLNVSATQGNIHCLESLDVLLQENAIEYDGGWIQEDVQAQRFMESYAAHKALPGSEIYLSLPYSFQFLEAGDLILYEPEELLARIFEIKNQNGFMTIGAQALPFIFRILEDGALKITENSEERILEL